MAGSDSSLWARLDQAFAFGMPDENGGRWEVVDPSRGRPRTRSGSSRAEHKDKVGINVTVIMPPDQQQQQFLQQQLEQRLQQWDLASQPMYSVRSLQAVSSMQSLQSLPLQPPPQRPHSSMALANPASASTFGTPSSPQPQHHQNHQRQLSLQEFQLQQQQYRLQQLQLQEQQVQIQQQQAQLEFRLQQQQQKQQQEHQQEQQPEQEQQQQRHSPQQKPHASHSHQLSKSSLEGFADRPLPPVPLKDLRGSKEKGSPPQLLRPSSSSKSSPASRPKVTDRRRSASCQPTHRRNTSSSSSIASYVLAASAPSPSLLPLHASPSSPTTKLHPPRSSQQNPEPTPKTTSWARHSTQQLSQQLAQTPTPTQILTPALTETVAKPTQTVRQRRSKSLIKSPILAPLELSPLRTTPAPATAPMPVTAAPMSSMSSTTVDIRPYTPLVQSTLTAPTCDTGKPPSSRQSDAAFSVAPKSSSKSSSKSRSQSSSSRSDDADAVSIMGESRRSNSPFRTLKSFSSSSRLRPSAAAPGKAVRKFMRLASMAASSAKDAVSGPILQKNEHGNLYPIRSPIFTGGAPSASASASSEASSPGFLISPSIVTTTSTSSSRRSSAFPSISTPVPQNLMLRHRSMSKIQQLTGLGMGDDDSSAVDPGVSASSLRRSMSTDMNMSVKRAHHASLIQTSSASASFVRSPSAQSTRNEIWNTSMFPSDSDEEDRDEDYKDEPTDGDADAGADASADADIESDEREVVVEVKVTEGEDRRSTKNNNSNTVMTPVTPDTPDLVTASLLQSLSQTSTKPPPSFQTAYQSPYQSAFAQYQPYQPSYQSYQSDRNLLPPNRMLKSKRYSDPNMAPIIEHPDDSSEMNSKRSSTSHYSDEAPAEVELESTMKADMNVEADLIEAMIEKLQQETIGESLPTDPASVPEESFDVDEESSFIPSRAPPVPISHPNRPTSRSSLRPSDAGTTVPVSAFSSFTTSSLSSLPTPSSIAKHIPSIRLFPSAIASAVSGTTSGASSSSPSPVSATSPSMPNISNPWPAYPPPRPAPPPPLQLDDISEVDDDEHAAGEGAEKRFSGSATSNYRSSVAMSAATSNRLSSSYHARSKSSGSASESIANSVSSVMSSVGSSVGNRATGGGCGYNGYNSFSSFSSNSTNGTGSNRLSFQQPSVPAPPVMTNTTTIMVPAQVLPPQVYPPPTSPLPAPPTSASKAHSPAPSLSQSAPVQDESRAQAQAQAQAPTPTKTQTQPFVQKQPSPISAFDHDDEDERSLAYRFKKGAVGAVPSRDSVRWRPSALGKSFFRREASPAPSEVSSFSSTGSRSVSAGFSSTPGSSSSQPTSHGHRTSLSATSIKAAGQRMAQATRKTVGGGSTSEQQRELEKEKWRENLRSQIRVIPEGQSAGSSDASATTPTSSMDARRASSRGRMI